MNQLPPTYRRVASALSLLQSPMLLAVRLYWGFQFAQTGWGKLHNLAKITGFFASLNIPFPAFNAPFVSTLELVGGILLMLGLFSRPIASLLAGNMLVAYWTADREALTSIFFRSRQILCGRSIYIPVRIAHGSDLRSWVLCRRHLCCEETEGRRAGMKSSKPIRSEAENHRRHPRGGNAALS